MDDINDKELFLCSKCTNFLKKPIHILLNGDNICGTCNNLESGNRNKILETIIETVQFACKFENFGCPEIATPELLHIHTTVCEYKPINCPKSNYCQTKWLGKPNLFHKHFMQGHPEDIISCNKNIFSFQILNFNQTFVKLLQLNTLESFLLVIKITENRNVFDHTIYNLINDEKYEFSLKYTGRMDMKIKFQSCSINTYNHLNNENNNIVDLSVLKQLQQSPNNPLNVSIKIKRNADDAEASELEDVLLCKICYEYMKPPIKQCTAGHTICNLCQKKLTECPTCRKSFSNARNYALEAVASKKNYPCKNKRMGCPQHFLLTDLEKHEQFCQFEPIKCPIVKCGFEGISQAIENHWSLSHMHQIFSTIEFNSEIKLIFNKNSVIKQHRWLMGFNQKLFKLNYVVTINDIRWLVQNFTSKKTEKFFYQLIVFNKYLKKNILAEGKFVDEQANSGMDKGIIIPRNKLHLYCDENNFVKFQIRIRPVVN